nr:nitronate monooxygenase family protein [uncultured Sellimonas sp.]
MGKNWPPIKLGDKEIKIPLIQGGMGVGISLGGLAGAVAKEGAAGIISNAQIGFKEDDFEQNPFEANLRAMEKEYKKARSEAPDGVIGFNIMVALKHYEEYVRCAVKIGCDLIISGAGLPTDLPKFVEGSDVKIAPIVSTDKSAKVILKYWDRKYKRTADMVVIEGPKAGGHLGFTKEQLIGYDEDTYKKEVSEILKTVKSYGEKYQTEIPVILAGGIDTKEKVKEAMELGVNGVQVASRFVTTEECDADIRYKEAYLKAEKEDIQIVTSPVGMPGRAILNPFMKEVMSGKKFTPKKCLGCLHKCNPAEIPYCITERLVAAAKGDVDQALLFCGADTYEQNKITTVKQVIETLMDK